MNNENLSIYLVMHLNFSVRTKLIETSECSVANEMKTKPLDRSFMLNLSNFHDIQTLIVTTSYVNVISRCVFFYLKSQVFVS